MSDEKIQTFRRSFSLPLDQPKRMTHVRAFAAVELAVSTLNQDLQAHLSQKVLVPDPSLHNFGTLVNHPAVKNPVITGLELTFIRDTGRFNPMTGEQEGYGEDRYHTLQLRVLFRAPVPPLKHQKVIDEMFETFRESWMNDEDAAEMKNLFFKESGKTMEQFDADIEAGVKNGVSAEAQLEVIKRLVYARRKT